VNLVAGKDIFLIFVSPLGITVRVILGAVELPFAGTSLLPKRLALRTVILTSK